MERGEIWWLNYPPSEARKNRDPHMVLLLSRDAHRHSRTQVTVALVTDVIRGIKTEVHLGPAQGLPKHCVVNADTLHTVEKKWLRDRSMLLGDDKMREVENAIMYALGITSPAGFFPDLPLR